MSDGAYLYYIKAHLWAQKLRWAKKGEKILCRQLLAYMYM